MEMQCNQEVVVTQQPQSTPNVVVVQQTAPRNNVPAIGALVYSVVTLVCCPGSLCCTIPACVCAILAMKGTGSDSEKSLYVASYVATTVYWILSIIAAVIIIILAVTGAFAAAAASPDHFNYFDNYYFG